MFFADAKAAFHLAVGDFEFPALPEPGEHSLNRQGRLPGARDTLCGDQIEGGLAVLPVGFALADLAMHAFHDDQHERALGQAFAHKRPQHLKLQRDYPATERHLALLPG